MTKIRIEGCLAFIIMIVMGAITVFIGYLMVVGFLYLTGKLPSKTAPQETVIEQPKPQADTNACSVAYINNWGNIEDPE